MNKRVDTFHAPYGDPCRLCLKPASIHHPYHKPKGDPCEVLRHGTPCGIEAAKHKARTEVRGAMIKRKQSKTIYIGVDGEGQGKDNHRYVLVGANDESGTRRAFIESERITTKAFLDFLLAQGGQRKKLFSFSFNYDLTKGLMDLPNKLLYILFRPELRARRGAEAIKGPVPVKWKGYSLNLQGTKFSVSRSGKRVVIWDLFKFYQASFVNALKEWKVGDKEMLARMTDMKSKRSEFDKESPDAVREYCLEECRYIAELARRLIEAHESAGLELKTFYGAGSSGAAMLNTMSIRKQIAQVPAEMKENVAQGFFGGRFENSVLGAVRDDLWSYDISSAYPYHTTFLPCLIHGVWEKTKTRKKIEGARTALIHYALDIPKHELVWGPFPFREGIGDHKGSISYPSSSGGGWVWKDEYLAGEAGFPNIQFVEAWIYRCNCECQPFKRIPEYYKARIRIGKEGPGIVIKLGVNSCYGKLAQSVGNALFNSWIWAGIITSGCRAQVLDIHNQLSDPSDLLMVATDGVKLRRRIITPKPRETGTDGCLNDKGEVTRKPLGGWEEEQDIGGVFFARPGVYFPLKPNLEALKKIKGRGVGKKVVFDNADKIINAYENGEAKVRVANVTRFCGAKTSVYKGRWGYARSNGGVDILPDKSEHYLPDYGQWIVRPVEMSFDPMPKRALVNADGSTLKLRSFSKYQESIPYDRALISKEAIEMAEAETEMSEQPDGDYSL